MSSVQRADRHLSVMASDFSAALDSIFDTNDSLFSLSVGLQQKKESIDHQSKELEELETQIRETEVRLKKAKRQSQQALSPPRSAEGVERQPSLPPQPQSPVQGNARPPRPSTASRTSSNQSVPTSPALNRPQSSIGNQHSLVDRTQPQRPATSQRA